MEDKIPFKSGRLNWRLQAVSAIMKNERYVGDMLLQKTYSEDALPYHKRKNKGDLPKYYVRNTQEPIVERITEDAVHGAFIRLYNKLKQNYASILLPILSGLEKLQELKTRNNLEISNIEVVLFMNWWIKSSLTTCKP